MTRKVKSYVNRHFVGSRHDINDLNLENNAWCIERSLDVAFNLYRRLFMEWMWFTFFPMRFILFISLRLAKPYCYHTISMLTKHCNAYMRYSKLDYLTFYYVLHDNTEPRRCSRIRELNQKVMRVCSGFFDKGLLV